MGNRCQVVLPLEIGIKIAEDEPVRKLVEICEELDYTDLYRAYLRHWRKIDPCTMFEILVFAYMNGIKLQWLVRCKSIRTSLNRTSHSVTVAFLRLRGHLTN